MPRKITPEQQKKKEELLKELRARELESLKKLKSFRDENLISFIGKPPHKGLNPIQARVFQAFLDPKILAIIMSSANRTGKTFFGILLDFCVMFGEIPWTGEKLVFPHSDPRKVRVIGQDWEKHIKSVFIPDMKELWPQSRPVTVRKNTVGVEAYWMDQKTGSTLEIMSNLQEAELHEGWHGDWVHYDEPPKRAVRIANARGLIDRRGREFFGMTLLKEDWIDREIIKKKLPDGRPDPSVFAVTGDIWSNVGYGITEEGIAHFESMLTEDEKSARLHGIPAYMSGLVYPQFQDKYRALGGHIVERFDIPSDWPVDIAIDVHPRKKQAILFGATDPKNEKYFCEEINEHGDAKWITDAILRSIRYHNYRVNRIIIDPFAKGDSNNEYSVFDIIARGLLPYGYTLETASKDKEQGVLEVRKHLKGPNKMPSMWIFEDLVHTRQQLGGLMWDEDTQKVGKDNDDFPENMYRLLLLNTEYSALDEQEYAQDVVEYAQNRARDVVTGY